MTRGISHGLLWKGNKVVPQMALYYAQMDEINLNLSCSQNGCWNP